MKNWFKRNGGYLFGGFGFVMTAAMLSVAAFAPGPLHMVLCFLVSSAPFYFGVYQIHEQIQKNKEALMSDNLDLKFEDKTTEEFTSSQQIESNVRYIKNHIVEDKAENDNQNNLTL